MEPLSAFYNSPLVVLDFQSLYPSVMVAYNYCYSTCLGRVTPFKGQYKFGVAETDLPPGLLATLEDHITGNGTCASSGYQPNSHYSCSKRHHVCQVGGTKGPARTNADGAIGHESHGQASYETCTWQQGGNVTTVELMSLGIEFFLPRS
jgi:hypothetical protein